MSDEQSEFQPQPSKRIRSIDLLEVMTQTIERLRKDKTARGDLKILSRTLIELRYAFSIFRPLSKTPQGDGLFGSTLGRLLPIQRIKAAEEFGRQMAASDWMVLTGAGGGIMEAGHRGAGREHSMGLNIMLPFEQGANPIIHGDRKLVTFKYFFTRKLMFVRNVTRSSVCREASERWTKRPRC
ncbi:MAG: hypothetical protein R3C05_22245 [Pirellulaceae bacterium]